MIYAIGDSFTYGDELESQEQAWPAVLSKLLCRPVTNKGRSATGNTRIVKRAIDAVIDQAEMIVIGWTDCNRQEFADDMGIYDLWAGRNFRAVQKDNGHRIDQIKYMTAYDNPEYYYADWLRKIILVQSLCQVKNIPLIMCISCGTNDSHKQYHTKFPELINAIDQTQFAHSMSDSVAEWTYGTPHGPNGHPLVTGHEIIANKIYEHIRNISRIS
jgi:lysophospholipase L1-like esterase